MQTAVITASASVIVAVLVFVLNQRGQVRQERRQARLSRINSQLRELYGPLHALVDINERIWESLRASGLPSKEHRQPAAPSEHWRRWRDHALMPANLKMRDLIIEHADLLIEIDFPKPLQDFCAHVTSYEVFLFDEEERLGTQVLVRHPGSAYVEYVRNSFARLKAEQLQLLRMTDLA
ncbi:hypothetical protein [Streptosporangium canum]|uniref:hypothetical protein n=1 Tax=Streptosporangium canum TaxID=324952 RepID=UPI00342BD98D